MVEMIGQVQKDNIPDLYSKVDYVFSFPNWRVLVTLFWKHGILKSY